MDGERWQLAPLRALPGLLPPFRGGRTVWWSCAPPREADVRKRTWKSAVLVLLAACGAWATCQDTTQHNCTDLVRERGCDFCCNAVRQSVRTVCPASCGLCAAPTSGLGYKAEQEALVRLYDSTSGTAWTRRDRWLDADGSHCFWFGVNCDEDGKVTILYLSSNQLSGVVPGELSSLTQLTQLDLYSNSLSGAVPVELVSLIQLTGLNLGTNSLSGVVPVGMASLTQLTRLYLSSNPLSGSVPVELASLTQLTQLDLYSNSLSGVVPVELGSLIQLTGLNLGTNRLSGSVPVELGSLTQLTELYLSTNSLSGVVPVELASLTQLTQLDLHTNRLSGVVPVGLASLIQLTGLDLDTNSLSGVVPVGLGSLTQLTQLDLYSNSLSGVVPVELGSLTQLAVLNLHTNRLSGSVPVELGSLTQLTELYLYSNSLSGAVPVGMASLTQLTELYLMSNRLSGVVPVGLGSLTQLTQLGLMVLLSMVLDEVLVLGLAVPVVLPLGCLAVASRLAAVHLVTSRLGVEFEHGQGAGLAWWFFLVSLLLGAALLLWVFISNAGRISGSLVFYVGAPVGLLVGGSASWAWHLKHRGAADGVPQVLLRPLGTASPKGAARTHAHAVAGDYNTTIDHADLKYTLFEDGPDSE